MESFVIMCQRLTYDYVFSNPEYIACETIIS